MKTKEEILSEVTGIPIYRLGDDRGEFITKSAALEAMKRYNDQFMEQTIIIDVPTKEMQEISAEASDIIADHFWELDAEQQPISLPTNKQFDSPEN